MLSRRQLANAIRALSMDAVERARSGHPGAPLGMADIVEVLYHDHLKHHPKHHDWVNRDRLVMSNGHGSMLLYAALHLSGYDLSIEDIKQFRQLHSKTPGHPEYMRTPGIETTTGPLGQGMANAVGMALAEAVLAAQFNRDGVNIVDHNTYVLLGDGCLMEGISHEAASFAGTLGLPKLIMIYDDNQISIDGEVSAWFNDDTPKRFEAYGFHVVAEVDGHDAKAIQAALTLAHNDTERPSLICCQTTIGYGSPNKAGSASCHGAPLGADEVLATRAQLGWDYSAFEIPEAYYAAWDSCKQGEHDMTKWQETMKSYEQAYPDLANEFKRRIAGELPTSWAQLVREHIEQIQQHSGAMATRKASQNTLQACMTELPELIGGSADLKGSNLCFGEQSKDISRTDKQGNYIYYGVREFAMSAINNGISLHGGFIPYGGTFLVFSDYARNALRMAALMNIRNIFVFTHDSIGLGEDGPTHQAVEHAASLRLIPNMSVWRPCDEVETAIAWQYAIERKSGPVALLLSRQNLPMMIRSVDKIQQIQRGAYILLDSQNVPDLIIIATGSEVAIAVEVAVELNADGRHIRVVSMPSVDVFEQQDKQYQDKILPLDCEKRVVIEAGVCDYWLKYTRPHGKVLGVDQFGESAPGAVVYEHFGLTHDNLKQTIFQLI